MSARLPSATSIRRLNARQRKKLHVGEFREFIFELRVAFHTPLADDGWEDFVDALVGVVETRGLLIGGIGGTLPIASTVGVVMAPGRSSPTDEDREAVAAWLRAQPNVASAEAGPLVDSWYGWGDQG